MVYVPSSPLITIGQIYIALIEHTKEIDASIQDTINCLSKVGLEANKLYQKTNKL